MGLKLFRLLLLIVFIVLSRVLNPLAAPVAERPLMTACTTGTLSGCAASMTAGTWAEFSSPYSSLMLHMIFPGSGQGDLTYNHKGGWDSTHHVGYFFGGDHSGIAVCSTPTFDLIACADDSQRFVSYVDSSNSFFDVVDVTGKPHSGYAIDPGGHTYSEFTVDPVNGDAFHRWSTSAGKTQKWTRSTNTWADIAAAPGGLVGDVQSGIAYYPEAGGLVLAEGAATSRPWFWKTSNNTWYNLTASPDNLTVPTNWGEQLTVAVYNPVLHNVLIGGGSKFPDSGGNRFNFYILSYSSGTWSISSVRSVPNIDVCGVQPMFMDGSSQNGHVQVDPVTGHYLVVTRDASCVRQLWEYDSVGDTWTGPLTGGHIPPTDLGMGNGSSAGTIVSMAIPEYGVVMFIQHGSTLGVPSYAKVYLYKHSGSGGGSGDTTAPTQPTNVRNTGKTHTTAEIMSNASTDAVGVAGYRWFKNNVLVGSSAYPIFNFTGLNPNTSYAFKVLAYDAAGNESTVSSTVNVTTNVPRGFIEKCALSGVLVCQGFDDESTLKYSWATVDHGSSESYAGHMCDDLLGPSGLGKTNYPVVLDDSYTGAIADVHANGIAAHVGPGGTPGCIYPHVDTSIKHSGAGSFNMPTPSNSGQTVGEFYGVFKRFAGPPVHWGYIGPTSSQPDANAVHLGDVLWFQYYQRLDAAMLEQNVTIDARLDATYTYAVPYNFYTTGAGATQIFPDSSNPCPNGAAGIPSEYVGRTVMFDRGTNFTTWTLFTIASVASDHCSLTLNASPTPGGAGGNPSSGAGGTTPGLLYIGSPGLGSGAKGVGMFGNPHNGVSTHSQPSGQFLFLGHNQANAPAMYSYGAGGAISSYPSDTGGYQAVRGCANLYPGIIYSEPPCKIWHADTWHEITVMVDFTGFPPGCSKDIPYKQWIDGQITQDISGTNTGFWLCEGESFDDANGIGQFNLSPYHTGKSPTVTHTDKHMWFDDFIVSTQPIPMGSTDTGGGGGGDSESPITAITAPSNGSTQEGFINVTATATDNISVVGVQFKIDSVNIGSEVMNSPYTLRYNLQPITPGAHTLTAVARDPTGNLGNASITINVKPRGNIIKRIFRRPE